MVELKETPTVGFGEQFKQLKTYGFKGSDWVAFFDSERAKTKSKCTKLKGHIDRLKRINKQEPGTDNTIEEYKKKIIKHRITFGDSINIIQNIIKETYLIEALENDYDVFLPTEDFTILAAAYSSLSFRKNVFLNKLNKIGIS